MLSIVWDLHAEQRHGDLFRRILLPFEILKENSSPQIKLKGQGRGLPGTSICMTNSKTGHQLVLQEESQQILAPSLIQDEFLFAVSLKVG